MKKIRERKFIRLLINVEDLIELLDQLGYLDTALSYQCISGSVCTERFPADARLVGIGTDSRGEHLQIHLESDEASELFSDRGFFRYVEVDLPDVPPIFTQNKKDNS